MFPDEEPVEEMVIAPVEPERPMPEPAISEVTPVLVIESPPGPTTAALPEIEMPVPLETVEVETLESALVPLPYSSWLEVNDVCPVPPFPKESVPFIVERVVVATHVGTPETSASTWPFVPALVVETPLVPLPSTTAFAAMAPCPVPPFASH